MEKPYEEDEDEMRRRRRRMRRRQEIRRRRRRQMLIRRMIKVGIAAAVIGIVLLMIKMIWGKINPGNCFRTGTNICGGGTEQHSGGQPFKRRSNKPGRKRAG